MKFQMKREKRKKTTTIQVEKEIVTQLKIEDSPTIIDYRTITLLMDVLDCFSDNCIIFLAIFHILKTHFLLSYNKKLVTCFFKQILNLLVLKYTLY
jgi:hypothetical protein